MTFSIVARSPDGLSLGAAVASRFLAAGAYVPAAAAGIGAVATQAYGNLALRTEGFDLLRKGHTAAQVLKAFFRDDPKREERQAGIVDAAGGTATFTGERVQPWAGGKTGNGREGSFAAQGNMLVGPQVVEAIASAWCDSALDAPIAGRLIAALRAGQEAGGDRRGQQAAAVIVVSPGGGYGGQSDVVVDLRCDDSPAPIAELERMLGLHELYFGSTLERDAIVLDESLAEELRPRLARAGYTSGDVSRDLYDWMGRENFEGRWHDGKVDPIVLEQLRRSV